MNSVININQSDIEVLETPVLRHMLAESLTLSAKHLDHMARIWSELERRGEDLSDLKTGLAAYLPLIARGKLSAQALIRFAGQRMLLDAIALLPIDEQLRIAMGKSVPLMIDGECREVRPDTLSPPQIRLVFNAGSIRNPAEQAEIMKSRRAPPEQKPRKRVTVKEGMVRIGSAKAPLADVLAALGDLTMPTDDIPDEEQTKLVVTISRDELRSIKILAAECDSTMQKLVRGALAATGAFSKRS